MQILSRLQRLIFVQAFINILEVKGKNMTFCLLPKGWKGTMINILEWSKGVLERSDSYRYKNPIPYKSVQFWVAICFQRSVGTCAILMTTFYLCVKANNQTLSHLHALVVTGSLRLNFSSCHRSCVVLCTGKPSLEGGQMKRFSYKTDVFLKIIVY